MGHICANFIEHRELKTSFCRSDSQEATPSRMNSYTECEVVGATRDDAAGEAYETKSPEY